MLMDDGQMTDTCLYYKLTCNLIGSGELKIRMTSAINFTWHFRVNFWIEGPQPSRKQAYSNILKILPPKNENF